ncbi:hypothetical protein BgiBS90_000223, partial [Biomphalaria glabrata]
VNHYATKPYSMSQEKTDSTPRSDMFLRSKTTAVPTQIPNSLQPKLCIEHLQAVQSMHEGITHMSM